MTAETLPCGFLIIAKKSVISARPFLIAKPTGSCINALATGAFFIAGVSAYKMLKKQEMAFFKKSFQIAMIVALVSGIGVAFSGHEQAQHLMKSQPMKMAASEALWDDSGDPAAWTMLARPFLIAKPTGSCINELAAKIQNADSIVPIDTSQMESK